MTSVRRRDLTLLDGGMGKELRRIGAPFRQPEWSALSLMESPAHVVEAHRNFIDAGAQVIITNNYAVVPFHLGDDLIAERGAELVSLAGELARRAARDAPHDVRVAGSLPPLFGSYEPEKFDPERAPAQYRMIVDRLAPWVDLWIAETVSSVAEIDAIADAVRLDEQRRPVWWSFSLPDEWSDRGVELRSGESIDDVVAALERHESPTEAILFNCSLPEQTGPALDALHAALVDSGLRVRTGGYANAFPAHRGDDYAANAVVFERRADMTPARYADIVAGWVDRGASIVGGCCDMYPEHIAALADRLLD